jgi:hypothetical protein
MAAFAKSEGRAFGHGPAGFGLLALPIPLPGNIHRPGGVL